MSRRNELLKDRVPVYVPSLKKTIQTPKDLSRIIFCLNRSGMTTKDSGYANGEYYIILNDYNRFIGWLTKINESDASKHKEFIKFTNQNVTFAVCFADGDDTISLKNKNLQAKIIIPRQHIKQFDTVVYHALRVN